MVRSLSKLLLRQGIVYSGGRAWTGAHDTWLRRQRFDASALQLTFKSDCDAVLSVKPAMTGWMSRSRRWLPSPSSPRWWATGWCARDQHPDRVRVGGQDRRLAPLHRQHHRLLHRSGLQRVLLGSGQGLGIEHPDRQQPCPQAPDRGRLAPPRQLCGGKPMRDRGELASPGCPPVVTRATGSCTTAGTPSVPRRKRHVVAKVALARELAGWCWSQAALEE